MDSIHVSGEGLVAGCSEKKNTGNLLATWTAHKLTKMTMIHALGNRHAISGVSLLERCAA